MDLRSNFYKYSLLAIGAAFAFTSCSDDDEPDNDPSDFDSTEILTVAEANLDYDSDGVWKDNYTNSFVSIDDYEFSHASPYDNYANGFTPSKVTDTAQYADMYLHPYASMTGGGTSGKGSPYMVAFWDFFNETSDFATRSCRVYEEEGEPFMPQSVMVNNNTYVYYTVKDGNAFSRPFAKGDWLKLIVHGLHTDGSEATVDFYLADYRDSAAGKIVTDWTTVDLTSLGICTGLYFTMESSDSGDYGMNTPSYFCLDKLIVKD